MVALSSSARQPDWIAYCKKYWPIFIGLIVFLIPTYINLIQGLWQSEDQAHGPLILLVVLYLVWRDRDYFWSADKSIPKLGIGWIVFLIAILLNLIGRTLDILTFEIGSQILVFIALLLMVRGYSGVKKFWFPLFFIIFMIPLPSMLVDAITLPMKLAVSYVAENILYSIGYPIARTGVILQIGQYQLLVADACAGLHTLISLEALGLLYLNIVRSSSVFRNITLAMLIIPISFTANVIRVMVLTLITYHFGDEAGQGFIHGFAGMLLFVVALALIISVDSFLHVLEEKYQSRKGLLAK